MSSLNETQGVFPILGPGFAAAACRVVPSPGSCGSEWGGWKSRGGRGFGVAMGKPWYVCQEWSQPCAELSAMCCHLWGEWRPAHVVLSTGLSSCGVTFQLRVLQKLGVAGANGCLPCDRWDAKVKESSRAGTHVTRFSVCSSMALCHGRVGRAGAVSAVTAPRHWAGWPRACPWPQGNTGCSGVIATLIRSFIRTFIKHFQFSAQLRWSSLRALSWHWGVCCRHASFLQLLLDQTGPEAGVELVRQTLSVGFKGIF